MPKDYSGQEPVGWFTAKGVHIPLYEGETPDDAIARLQNESSEISTDYKVFGVGESARKNVRTFLSEESNFEDWEDDLSSDERRSIRYYTDDGYRDINGNLYKGYSNLQGYKKEYVDEIDNAVERFELYEPMRVTRQADIRMLGFEDRHATPSKKEIVDKLLETHRHLEYPAYLSSSADEEGREVNGGGVVVHIGVPAGKGIGIYTGVPRLSPTSDENEFLFARNAVLKYDVMSLRTGPKGEWVINAEWVMAAPDDK